MMTYRVTEVDHTTYHSGFGSAVPVVSATVEFTVDGEVTIVTFSHREDDPAEVWCADSRIGPRGEVHFSHGVGDRTCKKQIANPDLSDAIAMAVMYGTRAV